MDTRAISVHLLKNHNLYIPVSLCHLVGDNERDCLEPVSNHTDSSVSFRILKLMTKGAWPKDFTATHAKIRSYYTDEQDGGAVIN